MYVSKKRLLSHYGPLRKRESLLPYMPYITENLSFDPS